MNKLTTPQVNDNIPFLVEQWLKTEQNGEQFPVPFDIAWKIAGYSAKGKGKRVFTNKSSMFVENEDFAFTQKGKWTKHGRSSDIIVMTTDCFKQFCLAARTIEGRNIRQYFIEVEKQWRAKEVKIKARQIPNYLPARQGCMDELKYHGATGSTYASIEKYNNELNNLESGQRDNLTVEQAQGLTINYLAGTLELVKRDRGFAKNQRHLANTTRMAMRHQTYQQIGEENVPDKLKPKHERKLLTS